MKSQRQNEIMEILKEKKFATVSYLAKKLFSSAPTIRRDLTYLEDKGFVKRSHGGAMLADENTTPVPIDFRTQTHTAEKMQICKKASGFIKENSVIFIDCSTTTLHLADFIPQGRNITVVTNSFPLCALLNEKNVTTYCTGGLLVPQSKGFVGKRAEAFLEDFCADACFFSSYALDDEGKITDYSDLETSFRKTMLKNSRLKIFMCDVSKVSKKSVFNVASLDDVDYVVTDKRLDLKKAFNAKNIY